MSKALDDILERRARLVRQANAQRAELGRITRTWETPLNLGGQALQFLTVLKNPLVITGLTALLFKTKWRRFSRWPALLFKAWKIATFIWGLSKARGR